MSSRRTRERMRVLLDTNVALDLLLDREPFSADALLIFALGEAGRLELLLSTDAISTIAYVVERNKNIRAAHEAVAGIVGRVRLAALDEATVLRALALGFSDIEDALVAAVAERERVRLIITRNKKDFERFPTPVMSPHEFLAYWRATRGTDGEGAQPAQAAKDDAGFDAASGASGAAAGEAR